MQRFGPPGRRLALSLCLVLAALAAGRAGAASGPIAGVVPPRTPGLSAPAASPAANLVYGGGPVLRTNRVYAIYWLPAGSTLSPGYRTIVDGYLRDVAASSGAKDDVYSVTTEYHDTTGAIAHSSTFGGSYVDTAAIPTTCSAEYALDGLTVSGCVSQADERAELDRVLAATGWTPGPTTLFFLLTPQGVGSCAGPGICAGTYFCAYHSRYTTTIAGHTQQVIWANEPYPDLPGTGGACDTGVHPNGDVADAAVNLVSHEHIESITDPDTQTGWFDGSGREIADKCAWQFGTPLGATGTGSYNQAIGTGRYRLQQEWSNAAGSCVLRPSGPAPRVTSISPSSGAVGATVTIRGAALAGAISVAFGPAAAQFTVVSPTELRATVPGGAAGGPVSVTTADGSAASASSFRVTPAIVGLSPASGLVGDAVAITGTSLAAATSVAFGDANAQSFTVDSDTQITALVPDAAHTGRIRVVTPAGTVFSAPFGVRPTLDPLAVTNALAGTTLTITGRTLADTRRVEFGTPAATGSIRSAAATRVLVTVPTGAVGGPIVVTNAGGSTSTAGPFTVLPRIASRSPSSGAAGRAVTISGSGLAGATDVSFNGTPATVVADSATRLVALVPPTATAGPITVTTPGGIVATARFGPQPRLTAASPAPAQAGDALTLTGTNLAGATILGLGGRVVPVASVDSPTQITTGPLPDTALTGSLRVATPVGTASITVGVRPTIDPLAVTSGAPGSVLLLTGKTFTGTRRVTFGGSVTARFSVVSNTQLRVTVPSAAPVGPITVTNAGGSTDTVDSFSVLPKT